MIARLRTELGLVGTFLRNGGAARAALVAMCTALVSGLLLVALTVVLFAGVVAREQELVSDLIADSSTRGGFCWHCC